MIRDSVKKDGNWFLLKRILFEDFSWVHQRKHIKVNMTEKEKQKLHLLFYCWEYVKFLNFIAREGLYKIHKINKTNIFQKSTLYIPYTWKRGKSIGKYKLLTIEIPE